MKGRIPSDLLLCLYPTSRGFAFVLFDAPESPFDWGVKEIREKRKNRRVLEAIEGLIERHQPTAIVIEDAAERSSRRTSRIRKLYRALTHVADARSIELYQYPQSLVRKIFSSVGASTKYEIAKAIARQIPAFATRVPRFRKPWMSEDPRQSLFDAAALGITHFTVHLGQGQIC